MKCSIFSRVKGSLPLLMITLVACSQDSTIDSEITSSESIHFRATLSDETRASADHSLDGVVTKIFASQESDQPLYLHQQERAWTIDEVATRASKVTALTTNDVLGMFAYRYTSKEKMSTPNFMYNIDLSYSNTLGGWAPATAYYWPGNNYLLRFYAYAPYGLSGATFSGRDAEGAPTFTYTDPTDCSTQVDVITAASDEYRGDSYSSVALNFRHALTAISFVASKDMPTGTISQISIKGVYSKGTCDFTDNTWSDLSTPATYTQTFSPAVAVGGTTDTEITSSTQYFMMIPQTLPSDASIEVTFTDSLSQTARTITYELTNATWQTGKCIVYRISSSSASVEPIFEVSCTSDSVDFNGGSTNYSVTSYINVAQSGSETRKVAAAWTAQFYDYNEATKEYDTAISQPSWLTAFTSSGNGAASTQTYTATLAAQTGICDKSHADDLKNATPCGTKDAPYDLAMYTVDGKVQTGLTTANCYVVAASGYYAVPLVYGNALKNGATNEVAYHPGGTTSDIYLATFVNHLDADITAPCLQDNANVVPDHAELLWNDVCTGFITVDSELSTKSVAVDGATKELKYLTFYVPKTSIKQGNAVVAVKDASGNALWSWHIWVTNDKIGETKTVYNHIGETFDLSPVCLGYCDGEVYDYAARSVRVVFTQSTTGKTEEFILKQLAAIDDHVGNNTFYQWGRKDAFLPGLLDEESRKTSEKPSYNASGALDKAWTYQKDDSNTIGTGIASPTSFLKVEDGRPYKTNYRNLWSAKNTATSPSSTQPTDVIIKTVYDPCPVGFHVAPVNTFTGFSTTGNATYNVAELNAERSSGNGWDFYCKLDKDPSGGTIFFPESGFRSMESGTVYSIFVNGRVWTAIPYSDVQGCYFYYYSGHVNVREFNYQAQGFTVWPVKDTEGVSYMAK